MSKESERASIVLGSALLDEKLKQVFKRKLSCFVDKLVDGMGPLSTFSSRISLARALEWISEEVRSDLDTIRKIRNDFAHSIDYNLSFFDDSVKTRCENLKTSQAYIGGFDDAANAWKPGTRGLTPAGFRAMQSVFTSPRKRYELAVSFLSQYLDEVPEGVLPYTGSDILEEIRSISANSRIEISATLTVESSADKP